MCERLKQAVLKTAVPERVPGVRIPLPPPSLVKSTIVFASPRGRETTVVAFDGSLDMNERKRERWEEIAEQVVKEQDTEKLLELTKQLDNALAEGAAKKTQGQKSSAA
jgi:hypothetical protein